MSRTLSPQDLIVLQQQSDQILVLDIRKQHDFDIDPQIIKGANRHQPEEIDRWIEELPINQDIIIYCVHGHAVSNTVLDRLLEGGLKARYIEGGIEAWKDAGGETILAVN
jgi:rhodanese-related sulfurtransferase|tara:strand:+ start:10699 stop:11028 length:330 start_codon:yes stop_codon:yes gene_type:complete